MQISQLNAFAKNMINTSKKLASQVDTNGMTSEIKYYGEGVFETIKRNPQGQITRIESKLFNPETNAKMSDIFRYQDGATTKFDYDQKTGGLIRHTTIKANGEKCINNL